MLSSHPCSSSSGCELAFLFFSLQNHKAESPEFYYKITQNLHSTLQHCISFLKRTHSPFQFYHWNYCTIGFVLANSQEGVVQHLKILEHGELVFRWFIICFVAACGLMHVPVIFFCLWKNPVTLANVRSCLNSIDALCPEFSKTI